MFKSFKKASKDDHDLPKLPPKQYIYLIPDSKSASITDSKTECSIVLTNNILEKLDSLAKEDNADDGLENTKYMNSKKETILGETKLNANFYAKTIFTIFKVNINNALSNPSKLDECLTVITKDIYKMLHIELNFSKGTVTTFTETLRGIMLDTQNVLSPDSKDTPPKKKSFFSFSSSKKNTHPPFEKEFSREFKSAENDELLFTLNFNVRLHAQTLQHANSVSDFASLKK